MSEKNQEGKRSARERLQAERQKDEARARRTRAWKVGGGILAVLVVAGGVSLFIAESRDSGGGGGPVAAPLGAVGDDKVALPDGAADAPSTLTVYEDFRCPACGAFEKGFRDTIHQLEDAGRLKAEYHLVTIIDDNLTGEGSLNAANAAACAQDQGQFRAYHDTLFANQPEEPDDKFADMGYLLELAEKVDGLKNPTFTQCVNEGLHNGWVEKTSDAFAESGFRGTPTVLLNGKDIYSDQSNPLTPQRLTALVEEANKGKKAGTRTPSITPSVASTS